MPKPANEQLRKRMLATAVRRFRESGYKGLTYSYIATECGVSKALVNYYYPKKEDLLTVFLERLLDESSELASSSEDMPNRPIAMFCRIGQLFYEFLLQTGGYRLLLRDMLEDRKFSNTLLLFNTSWAYRYLQNCGLAVNIDVKVRNTSIMLMGGFYDLLYFQLENNEEPDVRALVSFAVEGQLSALGIDADRVAAEGAIGFLDDALLKDSIDQLNVAMSVLEEVD